MVFVAKAYECHVMILEDFRPICAQRSKREGTFFGQGVIWLASGIH